MILETQGHGDAAYKEAIANLAHQVYLLNPSACFEGLVAAKATNILRPLDVHETYALITLMQLPYRKLDLLRRYVRSKQPNNMSMFASRIDIAKFVRTQPQLLQFGEVVITTQVELADDFTTVRTKYSHADMVGLVRFYLSAMSERNHNFPPGISLNGRPPSVPIIIMGDAAGVVNSEFS